MLEKSLLTARLLRLAAAVAPLSVMLSAPLHAEDPQAIEICSGGETRVILLPPGDGSPVPRKERESGCVHFTCPRDRSGSELTEDDEE